MPPRKKKPPNVESLFRASQQQQPRVTSKTIAAKKLQGKTAVNDFKGFKKGYPDSVSSIARKIQLARREAAALTDGDGEHEPPYARSSGSLRVLGRNFLDNFGDGAGERWVLGEWRGRRAHTHTARAPSRCFSSTSS